MATLLSLPSMQVPFSQLWPCLKLETQGSGGAPQPAESIADASQLGGLPIVRLRASGNGGGKKRFLCSGPSCLLPTMPRTWPPPAWCRARDGSPGPRPAPEETLGTQEPNVAEGEAPVPQLERPPPPPPDLPSPRTSEPSAQHSSSSNPDTSPAAALRIQAGTPQAAVALTQFEVYHPQLNPYGLQGCARCGFVARRQDLQFRSGSWLCGFHFAVGDLEAELSSLGLYHVRRTRITNVIKAARDLCLTPSGEPER